MRKFRKFTVSSAQFVVFKPLSYCFEETAVSSQDECEENEGSFSSDESDPSPVLEQSFQIGNHVTFRSFFGNFKVLIFLSM